MSNPHHLGPPPGFFGTPQPDGSLLLRPEEVKWLYDVLDRVDVARSEVKEAYYERQDMRDDLRQHSEQRAAEMAAMYCVGVVSVAVEPRTDEDKHNCITRLRGELTIIRGGLPPRPAL